jgi:hypothetical protein
MMEYGAMAYGFQQNGGQRAWGGLRPVYMWRIHVNGQVIDTIDPTEVALITHRHPDAVVQLVPLR